jgi:excisionase family DNA binding protein
MKFRIGVQLLLPWSPQYDISTSHAAEILDVSPQTITRMIEDGTLKAYKVRDKINSPWRINYDCFVAYIEGMHKRNGLDPRF